MNKINNSLVPFVRLVRSTNSTRSTNEHRYTLEKGSIKHVCPVCSKKRFVRYIDLETGQYLHEQYGRCDRESNCGYFLNPYKTGYAKMIWKQERAQKISVWKPYNPPLKQESKSQLSFIPAEVFKQTLAGYEKNLFIQNLLTRVTFPFKVQDMEKVISLYNLGTVQNGYRKGAITFPFIDIQNNIRAIQVKHFDQSNHTTSTDFLHSIIKKYYIRNKKSFPKWLEDYNTNEKKVSCLFGEHLLGKYPFSPVALVEAPKTAIYGTLYFGFPKYLENFIWLAVYNKSSFSLNKLKVLQGRDVFIFPDLSKNGNTFKEWQAKAKEYENRLPGTRFIFSELLEQSATKQDKDQGKDLADYLIKQDWRLFRMHINREQSKTNPGSVKSKTKIFLQNEGFNSESIYPLVTDQVKSWDDDIAELESYFSGIDLPPSPIKPNQYSTITNVSLFIDSHLAIVKANNGKRTFLPYLNRLHELKQVLTTCPN